MDSNAPRISIIIPVGPDDSSWRSLLDSNIWSQQNVHEIIVCSVEPEPLDWSKIQAKLSFSLLWFKAPKKSRAVQMNYGAVHATGDFLWFLHADSELNSENLICLKDKIQKRQEPTLFYFDLKFSSPSFLMRINQFGAWVRTRFLEMPFGDQGFCLESSLFFALGQFNETLEVAEDLEFVLNCKSQGVSFKPVKLYLATSARKYEKQDWLKTTVQNLFWTFKVKNEFKKNNRTRVALAVFVKTPGFSAIKTRLAQTKGKKFAEKFYLLSVDCIRDLLAELVKSQKNLDAYWAVAEDLNLVSKSWSDFYTISQRTGGLGERLNAVYEKLFSRYQQVLFIGSDSPQLSADQIILALDSLKKNNFVIGPADDGGFYLLGGKKNISKEIWTSVSYSLDTTAASLIEKLSAGSDAVELLPRSFDVDHEVDLLELKKCLSMQLKLSESQQKLKQFLIESV